jgi:hypothetical protein
VHHVLYPIPVLAMMLNKWYCLNIFYTIQGKAQAQGLRVRLPTFPYSLTTKQNKHEAANYSRESVFTNRDNHILIGNIVH